MDQILISLRAFADEKSKRNVSLLVTALLAVGAVLVTVVAVLLPGTDPGWDWIRVTVGGLAGLGWFAAGYLWWYALSSDSLHERLNLREGVRLPVRRRRGLLFGLGWFGLLALLANVGVSVVAVVVGAINVSVLLFVWQYLSSSVEERAETEEEWEARQQENIWAAESKRATEGGAVSMEIIDLETAALLEQQGQVVQYMEFVEHDEDGEPYTVNVPVIQVAQAPAPRKRSLVGRLIGRK